MKADFVIHFFQDWTWLIKSIFTKDFNFFTFNFLVFDVEVDKIAGRIEVNLGLLGIGLFIAIPFQPMDKELEIKIKKHTERK